MLEEQRDFQNYYNQSIDDLISKFNTDRNDGLESTALYDYYLKYGYNELPKIKKSLWKVYLAPIFNFLILILIITGVLIIILGSPGETVITFTVVIVNSTTAIIQQFRAQKALDSLKQISSLKAKVIRDGRQIEIPTRELVPGDIIVLAQGSKIPADARLLDSVNLTIDEAPLTGESEPVEKNKELIKDNNVPIQNQANMVFMGTYVNTGRGRALITNTGISTEIGKISKTLNEMGSIEDIPLTKKLNRIGYILGGIVIINLTILIIYKLSVLAIEGNLIQSEIANALVDSILRSANVLPINLPLLSTLVLITGVFNMARSGVIIKNLAAIESLGRVSVICSDKTGTITKNEMTVEKFWINDNECEVSGSGYEPDGEILLNNKPFSFTENSTFQTLVDSMVLNNNASLIYEDVKIRVEERKEMAVRRALGSPTEAALLVLAEKAGYVIYDVRRKYEVLTEFSFSSDVKRMTTICKESNEKQNILAFSKGAPEKILTISTHFEMNGKIKEFQDNKKQEISELIQNRANRGYRTLAIAYKKIKEFNNPSRDMVEKDLVFLGFVSIIDPPRIGVRESVEECQSGDIKVVMITGDHPATAKTIASEMGIYKEGNLVFEGAEIKDLKKDDFDKATVFARVEPADKEIIVEKYQSEDKVVAMTGDGINDSLALKLANAGIAMGITGTDVAKETADMVISDDNFTSIEKGVRIGRGLFAKIRTIIYFFICLNIMEAVIFFSYEFIPVFTIFSSNWQHLYIYGIVHSFPSLALVIDKHPKDIMKEPPRNEEQILNKNMWGLLLIHAFLMGIGLVTILQLTLVGIIPLNEWNINPELSYIVPLSTTEDLIAQKTRTMFITTLYIVETMFIWSFRRPNMSVIESFKTEFSKSLLYICLFTLTLHGLLIVFSYQVNFVVNEVIGLNFQLNFMFLSFTDWMLCIVFATPGIFGIELVKYMARKKNICF